MLNHLQLFAVLLWRLCEAPASLAFGPPAPPPPPLTEIESFQQTGLEGRAAAYTALVAQASSQWGVPPFPLAALLQVESGWQLGRTSPKGAIGLAQFTPSGRQAVTTLRRRRGAAPFTQAQALDPTHAISAAAELLSHLQDHCGSLDRALGAYNRGRCGGVTGFRARVWQVTNRLRLRAGLPPLRPPAPPRPRPRPANA
jgi:soluble lytic murein transglycosylase-like protein